MRLIRLGIASFSGIGAFVLAACGGGGGGAAGAGSPGLVTLVTPAAAPGVTGVTYAQSFDAQFPHPPGVFLVTGGTLPVGLALDKDTGVLSGFPRQAGVFHFQLAARDGADPSLPLGRDANYAQAARDYALDVTLGPPHILPQSLPGATYRVSYGYQIDVAGGTAPFTFTQTGGSLPSGVAISPTGFVGNFPTQAQVAPFSFQVTVTDANGLQDTATLSLQVIVLPLLILTSNPLQEAAFGFAYGKTLQLASAGGGVPYTWSQKLPLLPGETDLASIGMEITSLGVFQNKPPAAGPTSLGTFNFTVDVVDEAGQHATRALTLKVNPGPVLNGISPNRASAAGPFTASGSNFQAGALLIFKPGPTQTTVAPTFVSPTTLSFNGPVPKPSNGSGAVDVQVLNPDGGSHTKATAFIFPASNLAFATKGFLSSNLSSTGLDCADVNGDGRADIVHCGAASMQVFSGSSSSTAGGVIFHQNLGGSPPSFASVTLDSANFYDCKFADVNVDGKLDVVAIGNTTIRVWIGDGLGGFVAGPTTSLPAGYGGMPGQMTIGKLNSDAIPDLAFGVPNQPWLGYSISSGRLYTLMGTGTGAFTLTDSQASTPTNSYGVISITSADSDGDGRVELCAGVCMNPYTGPLFNYTSVGTTGFINGWSQRGAALATPGYGSTTGMFAGDFLGTGVPAVIAPMSGAPNYSNSRRLSIFSGSGFSTETTLAAPSAYTKCGAAIDGDFDAQVDWIISQHQTQVLVFKGSTKVNVLTLDANVGLPSVSNAFTGRVASGDLDGDGKPDVLATTSYWAVSGMAANYGSTYTSGAFGNGGSMGVVFWLNTSN